MARYVIDHHPAPSGASPTTAPLGQRRGCLVAVVGAKGGVGTTWTAIHLAAARARVGRVALLDMDFHRGDVAGALDLWGARSAHELLEGGEAVDPLALTAHLVPHRSGFQVMVQPFDLADLVQPQVDDVRALLAAGLVSFDRVVADCGSRVDEAMLTTLTRADLVALVSEPTIPSLRDALRIARLAQRLSVPRERLRLILNRSGRGQGVALHEIPAQLHLEPVAVIPEDREVFGAMELQGRLAWEVARRAPVSTALEGLWEAVAGEGEEVLIRNRRSA